MFNVIFSHLSGDKLDCWITGLVFRLKNENHRRLMECMVDMLEAWAPWGLVAVKCGHSPHLAHWAACSLLQSVIPFAQKVISRTVHAQLTLAPGSVFMVAYKVVLRGMGNYKQHGLILPV